MMGLRRCIAKIACLRSFKTFAHSLRLIQEQCQTEHCRRNLSLKMPDRFRRTSGTGAMLGLKGICVRFAVTTLLFIATLQAVLALAVYIEGRIDPAECQGGTTNHRLSQSAAA
jgi:hypothetical protein